MAFADTMIDVLQKRAAESGLVLSKHQEPDEPFPRFEIALLGAAKDAPPLFSATSGGGGAGVARRHGEGPGRLCLRAG